MYADICIGLHIYRFIGVYLPHSGYSFQEFENAVMSMRGLLEDGMRLGYKCITGGDFNTQIGQGRRSNLLTDTFGETGIGSRLKLLSQLGSRFGLFGTQCLFAVFDQIFVLDIDIVRYLVWRIHFAAVIVVLLKPLRVRRSL